METGTSHTSKNIFKDKLDSSIYQLLIKDNEQEEILDFGRFCLKHKLYEEANTETETAFKFYSEPEKIKNYAETYDISEAYSSYKKYPEETVNVIDSHENLEAWEPIVKAFDFTPIEMLNFLKQANFVVVLENQQRPDAPKGVLASQDFIIVDGKAEFQPVIQNGKLICWKLRSAFFFGNKRLINVAAPKSLWHIFDEMINIEKLLAEKI